MANNKNINYEKLVVEWLTTGKSVNSIAKAHKISEGSLRHYIKKYNLTKNTNITNTISALDRGLSGLNEISNYENDLPADKAERLNSLIQSEIIEIVRAKNPQFAQSLQVISAKVIKKTNELLDTRIENTRELKEVTGIIKDINDTLQVIPKPASFAQQINLNQNSNASEPINIAVEFIDSKGA